MGSVIGLGSLTQSGPVLGPIFDLVLQSGPEAVTQVAGTSRLELELVSGIEPLTPSLRVKCSTS